MVKDYEAIWNNCLQMIKRNVNEQSFKTWFEPIRPVRLENRALTIQVPNKFFYEWLEEHYIALLKQTIKKELGDSGRLEYQILVGNTVNEPHQMPVVKATAAQENHDFGGVDASKINPFIVPGIKKTNIDPQLNPSLTFHNFIEGDCNRLARAAGMAIAKKPGETAFNPLVVFGPVGLGKTHLAQAIGNDVLRQHPEKKVLYVTAEKFTNQIISAIKNGAVEDLVTYYQWVEVLIVDDIQFLENKTKTQEIFFYIFNQLHQTGRQVILTSDRAPKDLDGIEERLTSRFKWGLSADMGLPDFETRMAILEAKMHLYDIDLTQEVKEYICYNIKNNVRELEGVLNSIIAYSNLNKKTITKDLARDVIRNFVTTFQKDITMEFIQNIVADHYKIPVEKLSDKTRKREVVIARQVSMYLAKTMTDHSLKSIGDKFGGRDHSTVIYSIKTVEDLIDIDIEFKANVVEIEKKLKLGLNK